jgi:hypothetical protein
MSIIILLIIGAIAYQYCSQLIKPSSPNHKPVNPPGSISKPKLKPKADFSNALIDFMFKPKSAGQPHRPKIRSRR